MRKMMKLYHDKIGLDICPYMERWVAEFKKFSARIHRWYSSDDHRAFHDHSWDFLTIVLWGSYEDISPEGVDRLSIGSIRYRKATHQHTVRILKRGTITLVITGPILRRWGFWLNGKLLKRDKYFAEFGHHPCEGKRGAVRMRPDGSVIGEKNVEDVFA